MFGFLTKKKPSPPVSPKAEHPLSLKGWGSDTLFGQLSEKEIIYLYNNARIQKVATGSYLIREGNIDRNFYLLLEGTIKIVKNYNSRQIELAVLRKGDCVGEIAFITQARRTASAIALEPISVMTLDGKLLEEIPATLRLKIDEYLIKLIHSREEEINRRGMELLAKNEFLVSRYEENLHRSEKGYETSEMITGIIDSVPRLPRYVNELLGQLLSEGAANVEIVKNINQDPSLVAVILKRVNSAYFNLQGKVDNLNHAVMLLGFNQVYDIVIDNGVKQTMPNSKEFLELQTHSFLISQIAYEIAIQSVPKKAMLCNTVGILHDIGKSIIFLLNRKYPKLRLAINLLDHTKVGALLLKEWGLPPNLCHILSFQNYPRYVAIRQIPAEIREESVILHLSHLYFDHLNGKKEEEMPELLFTDFFDALGVKGITAKEFYQKTLLPALLKKSEGLPAELKERLLGPIGAHT